jgi:hypothetical protein
MTHHHLKDYLSQQYQRTIHHREVVKHRMREDIREIERDLAMMSKLIRQMEHDRLHEGTISPTKPLTPEQSMERAEANRKLQQSIKDVQATANRRIADIRSKIGR